MGAALGSIIAAIITPHIMSMTPLYFSVQGSMRMGISMPSISCMLIPAPVRRYAQEPMTTVLRAAMTSMRSRRSALSITVPLATGVLAPTAYAATPSGVCTTCASVLCPPLVSNLIAPVLVMFEDATSPSMCSKPLWHHHSNAVRCARHRVLNRLDIVSSTPGILSCAVRASLSKLNDMGARWIVRLVTMSVTI
jgi:hypothetical protein